jgi:muconolactone delta-isomerase
MEYRVAVTTRVHEGTPAEAVGVIRTREAAPSRELAVQGRPLRHESITRQS